MKKETINKVCNFWNLFEEDDDISTERLLEMCRQEFNLQDTSDVVTALIKGGVLKEAKEGAEDEQRR